MRLLGRIGMVSGLLVLAPPAFAQGFAPTVAGRAGEEHVRSGVGVSVQAGGGVTAFAREAARETTNVGGIWEVRAALGTRRLVGLEAAYVGSARGLAVSGLAPGAALVGHGAEGALRINMPFINYGTLVEPFVFGGLGWTWYSLINEGANTSGIADYDNVGVVPVGAGLTIGYRGFIAEARFTYRMTFEDEALMPRTVPGSGNLGNWGIGLTAGYEF